MQDALNQLPAHLKETFSQLLSEHERIQNEHDRVVRENLMLRTQLRLMRLEKYGPRSEKLSDAQLELLDKEPCVDAAEVEKETTQPPPPASRVPKTRRAHPGRVELPAHLERREVIVPCQAADCVCAHCQQEKKIIGYERTEELDVIPAFYFVKVTLREKRACAQHPEGGVSCAGLPARILPKSKLSDAMIIDVLIKKFGDHLPAYRQSAILERDAQIELSRKTLVSVIMNVGRLMQGLIPALKADLFAGGYIQADETPVPCQTPEAVGKNHQAYLWEYGRPDGPVIFDFKMGRGREGPRDFLRGFVGILQSDGYAAYDKLGDGIVHAACLTHVRREFHRAHQLQPLDPRALEILERMGQLYAVEREARDQNLSSEGRLGLRQRKSQAIFEALGRRIVEIRKEPDVLPAGPLGKACKYAMGQWERLGMFLRDGRVQIDNNDCENSIRPLALGRRNWLHIGSEQAGPVIAAIASVFETCRRLEINPRKYLTEVMPRLEEWPMARVRELSPMAWRAAQKAT